MQATDELRGKGVEVVLEPFAESCDDGSSGTVAYIKDPNGIWIELYQTE